MDVRHLPDQSRFELEKDGRVAVAEYRLEGSVMTITHTWVPPELRGSGLAAQLIEAAFLHARQANLKIIPQCSYVETYLRRHPEYEDLRFLG